MHALANSLAQVAREVLIDTLCLIRLEKIGVPPVVFFSLHLYHLLIGTNDIETSEGEKVYLTPTQCQAEIA